MKGTRSSRLPSPAVGMKQQKLHSAQKSAHLHDQNQNNGTPIVKSATVKFSRASNLLQTMQDLVSSSNISNVTFSDLQLAACCTFDTYIIHKLYLLQPSVDFDCDAVDLAFFNQLSYTLSMPVPPVNANIFNLFSTYCADHRLNTSKPAISNMNQLQLTILLLFLSWSGNINAVEYFQKHNCLEGIVNELMKTLSDRKKNPKDLSMAVACVSFLVEYHNLSSKILTTANAIQLLKVCLSKSIYASEVSAEHAAECVLPVEWEFIGARLGLVRLLQINQVATMQVVKTEISLFLRKWWQRLVQAVTTSSAPYPTPSKSTGVSVVRCAMEVITDLLHSRVMRDEVEEFLRDDIGLGTEENEATMLRVLGHYMISEDPRTSYVSSRLLLGLLITVRDGKLNTTDTLSAQLSSTVLSTMTVLLERDAVSSSASIRTPLRALTPSSSGAISTSDQSDIWQEMILEPIFLSHLDILHVIMHGFSDTSVLTKPFTDYIESLSRTIDMFLRLVNTSRSGGVTLLVQARCSVGIAICCQALLLTNRCQTFSKYSSQQLHSIQYIISEALEDAARMESKYYCCYALKSCAEEKKARNIFIEAIAGALVHMTSASSRTPRLSSVTPIPRTTPSDISMSTPGLQKSLLAATINKSFDVPPPPPEEEDEFLDDEDEMTPEIVDHWLQPEENPAGDDMEVDNDPTSITIARLSISDERDNAAVTSTAKMSPETSSSVTTSETMRRTSPNTDDLARKLAAAESALAAMTEENRRLNKETFKLQSNLTAAQAVTSEQTRHAPQNTDEVSRKLSAAESALAAMTEENRRLNSENVKLQSNIAALTSRYDAATKEHHATKQYLEDAWQKMKTLALAEEQSRKEMAEAQARCNALESALELSQHEVSIKTSEYTALKSEFSSVNEALRHAHITEANLRTEKGKLQAEQLEYRHREEELKLQLEMSRQQCSQYSDAIKDLRQKYALQEKQFNQITTELEETSERLATEKKKLTIATSEHASKAARWNETEQSLRQQLATQVEALQSAAKVHQQQQEKAQHMEASLRQELHVCKQESSKHMKCIDELKRSSEKQAAIVVELQDALSDQQLRYDQQAVALEDATKEIQNLRNELSKHKDLILYINKLSAEADAAKNKRESLSK